MGRTLFWPIQTGIFQLRRYSVSMQPQMCCKKKLRRSYYSHRACQFFHVHLMLINHLEIQETESKRITKQSQFFLPSGSSVYLLVKLLLLIIKLQKKKNKQTKKANTRFKLENGYLLSLFLFRMIQNLQTDSYLLEMSDASLGYDLNQTRLLDTKKNAKHIALRLRVELFFTPAVSQ